MYSDKKLVVINKSFGELDWLAMNKNLLLGDNDYSILIYRMEYEAVKKYFPKFISDAPNVQTVEEISGFYGRLMGRADSWLDRVSTYIFNRTKSLFLQCVIEEIFLYFRRFMAYLIFRKFKMFDCDMLLYENNYRSSILLECLKLNGVSRLVFYPHHFGFTQRNNYFDRLLFKKINVDFVCVNYSEESDGHKYKKVPSSKPSELTKSQINPEIVIVTRQCSLMYGFSLEEAVEVVEKVLIRYGNKIQYIKNHPRDLDNPEWKRIAQKYDLVEVNSSLIDMSISRPLICITLYTGLIFQLSKLGVKCFDISPFDFKLLDSSPFRNEILEYINKVQKADGCTLCPGGKGLEKSVASFGSC